MFTISDPENLYSTQEVIDLLQQAQDAGLDLEKGSYLECLTIRQLDALVRDIRKSDT